jgi:hypothetical protein
MKACLGLSSPRGALHDPLPVQNHMMSVVEAPAKWHALVMRQCMACAMAEDTHTGLRRWTICCDVAMQQSYRLQAAVLVLSVMRGLSDILLPTDSC